ncbi:hypothetical protein [Streptomyces sp. NPDC048172]|uniref:hypothetical protein n=1 Tax=Streptomyces sp. NPDC048172 TaxID=3365505 RepID=UPI003712CE75
MAKTLIGAPIGAVAERAPIAGELMNGVSEGVIDSIVESHQKNSVDSDADRASSVSFDAREENQKWAQRSLKDAGFPPNVNRTDYIRDIAMQSGSGYGHGETLRREARDNMERRLGK